MGKPLSSLARQALLLYQWLLFEPQPVAEMVSTCASSWFELIFDESSFSGAPMLSTTASMRRFKPMGVDG